MTQMAQITQKVQKTLEAQENWFSLCPSDSEPSESSVSLLEWGSGVFAARGL